MNNQRMSQTTLKKMIELQARETAREQALGIAAQFLSATLKNEKVYFNTTKNTVEVFFEFADLLRPRLESELVAAKMAEVVTSTETEESVK